MRFLAFLPAVVCLGLCLVPAVFLRRRACGRAQDYLVSSQHTPASVIQNSSIAYALQMATFGPFFTWGASGDFWPAIISSISFGSGVYLMYILRRPILRFLESALSRDRSVTVHDFIARQHGNDPRVRLLASSLTVVAFSGLAIGEALIVAALLKPLLGNAAATYTFVYFMLMLMGLYTILSGNSGVMWSTQLQLGMLYLGLFGSTALLLYLLISALRPMPPHGTLAVAFVAACCAVMVVYRRSRYVDTSPISRASDDTDATGIGREPSGVRLFIRLEKILNVCISIFAVLTVVVAAMGLYAEGPPAIVRNGVTALLTGTRMPTTGLIALLLLALFYPIVDLTNWQRIAAFEKDKALGHLTPSARTVALRRIFRGYAVESPLVWLLMCMLGTIAVVAMAPPGGTDVMQSFVQQLASEQNAVAGGALSLLLISLFAIALSTMSSLFSATLCAIRYDILPAFWPQIESEKAQTVEGTQATRRAILIAAGLYLVIATAFCIVAASLQTSFTSREFFALLLAFYCVQLSFVPLILGPIIGRTNGGFGAVSPAWALFILAFSAATGVGAVSVYLAIGNELWLWAAIPACLGSGLLLFAIAWLWPSATPEAT